MPNKLGCRRPLPNGSPAARITGVSTDTRSVGRGQLFVAIRGEHFDGHDFLAMAKERGAAAALVDEKQAGNAPPCPPPSGSNRAT